VATGTAPSANTVSNFFGGGEQKQDTSNQEVAVGETESQQGQTQQDGQTQNGQSGQQQQEQTTGQVGQQPLEDDGTDTDGDGISDAIEKSMNLDGVHEIPWSDKKIVREYISK